MRLATLIEDGRPVVAAVTADRVAPLPPPESIRAIAAAGDQAVRAVATWLERQPSSAYRPLDEVVFAPVVPDPGAIYTIGLNYHDPARPHVAGPERPLVFGKAGSSVTGHQSIVAWDRSLTANVQGECELGVVVGAGGSVFGYTIINDVTSQDPWLDGDQWLLGKSMPGFCPVGPWLVTADELNVSDLRLGFRLNGVTVQDGRTSQMRFSIAQVLDYLSRHVELRPGDLIATGTPVRSGQDAARFLQPGDEMTCWIEGIGELTNTVA